VMENEPEIKAWEAMIRPNHGRMERRHSLHAVPNAHAIARVRKKGIKSP
jgi:hypothetical protein